MRIPAPSIFLMVVLAVLVLLAGSYRLSHSQDKPSDEQHGTCHCIKWKHGHCTEMLCFLDECEGDIQDDL